MWMVLGLGEAPGIVGVRKAFRIEGQPPLEGPCLDGLNVRFSEPEVAQAPDCPGESGFHDLPAQTVLRNLSCLFDSHLRTLYFYLFF